MAKLKVTRNDLNKRYTIGLINGQLQRLLSFFSPYGYNAGVYGWNWDVYDIGGYNIVTGYRSYPPCVVDIAYEDADKIDKKYKDKFPKNRKTAEREIVKLIEKAFERKRNKNSKK